MELTYLKCMIWKGVLLEWGKLESLLKHIQGLCKEIDFHRPNLMECPTNI